MNNLAPMRNVLGCKVSLIGCRGNIHVLYTVYVIHCIIVSSFLLVAPFAVRVLNHLP